MKTTYYTPTTIVKMVESYMIMASNSKPEIDPATPTDPYISAPARKLYV